jgi:hypothetical protein
MIALAGFAAESKRYDVKASHANRDRGKVLNAALQLSNGDLNRANALRKRKEIEVSIMVDADWQRIEALARRLMAEMEVHWPFGEQK